MAFPVTSGLVLVLGRDSLIPAARSAAGVGMTSMML